MVDHVLPLQNGWKINKILQVPKILYCALTVELNHNKIPNHSTRMSNIEKYADNYNMKNIKFAVGRSNWERFDKNNKSIVQNILVADETDKKLTEIKEAYISIYN